jgi:hypothetical protein
MYTYRFVSFMMSNNITCENNFPVEEYLQYLTHFNNLSFEFDKVVRALQVQLTGRSVSRIANVFLFACTLDDLLSYPNGQEPAPIGHLQFTLWKGKDPEIKNIGLIPT